MSSTAGPATAKKKQVTLHNTSLKVKPRTSLPSSPAMRNRSSASPRQSMDTPESIAHTPGSSRIASSPFKHAGLPLSVPTFAQATESSTRSTATPVGHQRALSANDSTLAAGSNGSLKPSPPIAPLAPMAQMEEELSPPEADPPTAATPHASSKLAAGNGTTTPAGQPSSSKPSFLNSFTSLFRSKNDEKNGEHDADTMVQISTPQGTKRPLPGDDHDAAEGATSATKKPRVRQASGEPALDTIAVKSSIAIADVEKPQQAEAPAEAKVVGKEITMTEASAAMPPSSAAPSSTAPATTSPITSSTTTAQSSSAPPSSLPTSTAPKRSAGGVVAGKKTLSKPAAAPKAATKPLTSTASSRAQGKLPKYYGRRRRELTALMQDPDSESTSASQNSAPSRSSGPLKAGAPVTGKPLSKASAPSKDISSTKAPTPAANSESDASTAEKKSAPTETPKKSETANPDKQDDATKPAQTPRAARAAKKAAPLETILEAQSTPAKAQLEQEPEKGPEEELQKQQQPEEPVHQQQTDEESSEPDDVPAIADEVNEEDEEEEDADEEEPVYEVIGIKNHRRSSDDPNRLEVLVSWRTSKPKEETTWEPEEDIQEDIPEMLWKYWKSVKGGRQAQVQDPDLWHVHRIESHKVNKQTGGNRSRGRPRKGTNGTAAAAAAGKEQISVRLLVQWVGSPERSWEPEEAVMDYAEEHLDDYWETLDGREAALAATKTAASKPEVATRKSSKEKKTVDHAGSEAAETAAGGEKTANTARKRAALPDPRRKGQAQRMKKPAGAQQLREPNSPEI